MVIGNISDQDWNKIKILISEVINRRKYKFNKEIIMNEIMLELKKNGFADSFVEKIINYSYFQIMFLNILDDCIEQGKLYLLKDIYIPFEYAILNNYYINNIDLLYLIEYNNNKFNCINIADEKKVCSPRKSDYILTGGINDFETDKLNQPNIPLDEFIIFYKNFIKEGASKEEAINHILNYYKVNKFLFDEEYNTLKIERKVKKKK